MKKKPRTKTLLKTVYQNGPDLVVEVGALLGNGADPNVITQYDESPLRVAANNGRFDVVRVLLDAGADPGQLRWTPSFFEVAFGTVASLEHSLLQHADIDARDFWQRTPWLLAILTGETEKTALLLGLGADRDATGRCDKTPLQYAVQKNDVAMLRWLIDNGCDPEAVDQFQTTPLIEAAELGMTDSVRYLVEHGVDIYRTNHIPQRAIEVAANLQIVKILVDQGDDINDIDEQVHADLVGTRTDAVLSVSAGDYRGGKGRRFGQANPEKINHPFWLDMIRSGASAWHARRAFSDDVYSDSDEPVWCFSRFGKSTTLLGDGRIVEIAGEHEDYYDPDFCIYNDVIVFDGNGGIEIFCYPQDVFPPTDFHTATLVGKDLYVIGNLGYRESRRPGETPVYRLDTVSLRIDRVDTSGEMPGWISRHKARLLDDGSTIRVSGGKLSVAADDGLDYVDNGAEFTLCVRSNRWRRSS